MEREFSELEKKALEVFVTSADDPIYAIRNTVPIEVFGAFGSYFSRNPKDFREHLLDSLYGRVPGEEVDKSSREGVLQDLAEGKYVDPSQALVSGLAKAQDFFKRWYGKYSHKSIANVVPIGLVGTGVSQLFARELAYDQLAFFIEQSTRYVEWKRENMHLDQDIMASPQREVFLRSIDASVGAYHTLVAQAAHHYQREIPFELWKTWQSDRTLKSSEREIRAKYDREIKGAALDRARFLLPQACTTNIAWVLDARSMEFDVSAWKGHPVRELRRAAELIEKHAGQIAPSLLKYTERSDYYADDLCGYGGDLESKEPLAEFSKGVSVITADPDSLDKTIAHLLKRHNRGGTFSQRLGEARNMSFKRKMEILKRIVRGRGSHDEWVSMDEEFDLVKTSFEIRSDVGAIRDWRRHQKWDRSEPLITLDNGSYRPILFDEMGPKAVRLYEETMELAHDAEREIRKGGMPYQAQFVVPMGARHSITMSGGLDQAQYMAWTRTTPEGNFSYREDSFNLAEALVRVHPWMLGYERYPEGKRFKQVYDEAPLKGGLESERIMNLQWGQSALHQ